MAEEHHPSKRPTDGFSVILFADGSGTIQCAPFRTPFAFSSLTALSTNTGMHLPGADI